MSPGKLKCYVCDGEATHLVVWKTFPAEPLCRWHASNYPGKACNVMAPWHKDFEKLYQDTLVRQVLRKLQRKSGDLK